MQKDFETLKIIESGTWLNLLAAYRDIIITPRSPSGLVNRYGVIPFAFPAAIELEGLGPISDALICRRRHDKYAVMSEKKLLLQGTNAQRNKYINEWRKRAVNKVCEAFKIVKQAERDAFGEKSYFYRKERGLSPAVSNDDPDPGNCDAVAAHGFEEPEAEEINEGEM